MSYYMHDWTFTSALFEWADARVILIFQNATSLDVRLIAEGVVDLQIPQKREWGRSVSVNETTGPTDNGDGTQIFTIEMQTGDVISIVARSFQLPP